MTLQGRYFANFTPFNIRAANTDASQAWAISIAFQSNKKIKVFGTYVTDTKSGGSGFLKEIYRSAL